MLRASLVAFSLALGSGAWAQAFDMYGFGAQAVAMGSTQGASDGDYTAAYYNPALLLGADRPNGGVGFSWMRPFVSVEPVGEGGAGSELTWRPPPEYIEVNVGANLPLGGILKRRAALGFGLHLPTNHIYRADMIDDASPYFYRYQSGADRMQIVASAAVRPWGPLAIGGGVQVFSDFGSGGRFRAMVYPGGEGSAQGARIVYREITFGLHSVATPLAGASIELGSRVKVNAAWRGEVRADWSLPFEMVMDWSSGEPLDTLTLQVNGVLQYSPHAFVLGARAQLTTALTVTADLEYSMWSTAPSPQVTVDIRFANAIRQILMTDCITTRQGNKCAVGGDPPIEFHDILVPRVGLEYRWGERLAIRGGAFLRPSPVPAQTGRTNLIDPTVVGLCAGAGYAIPDPLQMGQRLTFDLAVQAGVFAPMDVVKQRPNRLPDYRVSGVALDATASARYEF